MTDRQLGPTPGLSEKDWQDINGGEPKYINQRRALDGKPTVDIKHSDGTIVSTHDPESSPILNLLTGLPRRIIRVRTCDVKKFHGDPCAARSDRFKADRKG